MTGVVVLAVVLVGATATGLFWRSRDGRVRPAPEAAESLADTTLAGLGVDPSAADTTLVQFSSAFAAPCRAPRATLARVAADTPGVAYVEVDAESHLDEVRALDIRRTPTVLIVDRSGRVVTRAVGQPRLADVRAVVARDRAAD